MVTTLRERLPLLGVVLLVLLLAVSDHVAFGLSTRLDAPWLWLPIQLAIVLVFAAGFRWANRRFGPSPANDA